MSVTIRDIAELANVSRGTVDKVLNHRPGVKEETRKKVMAIAKELNYQPNFLGKALVQSQEPLKIGIILTPEYNPFVQEMIKGVRQAESEFSVFGIQVSIKMPFSLEPAEQISILNELEREKVAGIAILPLNDPMVISKVNSLVQSGIAVIGFNSKVQGMNEFCFVGQDHWKGGRTAAGLMSKVLPEPGRIGIIISSYSLSCHQDRLGGFREKCQESGNTMEIVEIQENQDRKEDAFRITMEYCNHYPDLKGIYITGGGIAGVGRALDLVRPDHKIHVICHDLVSDSRQLLENDVIDFVIHQNPNLQGYQLVKIMFERLVKKIKPDPPCYEIPIDILTQDSI